MKEISPEGFLQSKVNYTTSFELAYTLSKDAEAILASRPEGRVVFTRDKPETRIIIDNTVVKIWKGAASGAANELLDVGEGEVIQKIKDDYIE